MKTVNSVFYANVVIIAVLAVLAVIVLLVVAGVAWYLSTRNKFIRLDQKVQSAESRIDVYLTKRYDLLTKMVSTIKGYMKHEKETFAEIVKLRNPGVNASLKEKAEFDHQMNEVANQLNLVAERYPELKADKVFLELLEAEREVEENLQAARSNFNSNINVFNEAVLQFPSSIVAGSRWKEKEYFKAEETKKQDVVIDL